MMKIERSECPQWLEENWERWGRQWQAKRDNPNRRNDWQWYKYNGQKVNLLILPLLKQMTKNHCSFCDQKLRRETVEHLKPKSQFPLESYKWENLFVCCFDCQVRYDKYDENLLKPDELDYEFGKYFIYDYTTGEIKPNEKADLIERRRAEITIELYRLNELGLPEARLLWSNNWQNLRDVEIDLIPFRFIFQ